MMRSGEIWRNVQADLRGKKAQLGINEHLTIERMSSINMEALQDRLTASGGALNEMEWAFVDRFLEQPFWATHFTSATLHASAQDGESVSLISGPRLDERGVPRAMDNTTPDDIHDKSDHDHVFFALECGNVPQKSNSRFGTGVYRVPFESLAVSSPGVWGALDDILEGGGEGDVEDVFPDLTPDEARSVLAHIGPDTSRNSNRAETFADVFTGEHLLEAAALNLVNKFRGIQNDIGRGESDDEYESDCDSGASANAVNGADSEYDSDFDSKPHAVQAHDPPASLNLMDQLLLAGYGSGANANAGAGDDIEPYRFPYAAQAQARAQAQAQAQVHNAPARLHPMVQSCLDSNTSDEFNTLLRTFHRIEIRVPGRFTATEFQHFDAAMLGWLAEPNAASADANQERLEALVKFCSGSPANVERQLGVLREAGLDVRAIRSNEGGSLLHLLCANTATASAKQKQEVRSLIPALLAFGLDVNHVDASGDSVLKYARRDTDLLGVLVDHGANLSSQGNQPSAGLSDSRKRKAS